MKKGGSGHRITKAEERSIVELAANHTDSEIGEKLGRTRETIRMVRKRLGIEQFKPIKKPGRRKFYGDRDDKKLADDVKKMQALLSGKRIGGVM